MELIFHYIVEARNDSDATAEFLARLLRKDQRIAALKTTIPKYDQLQAAYEDTTKDNEVRIKNSFYNVTFRNF